MAKGLGRAAKGGEERRRARQAVMGVREGDEGEGGSQCRDTAHSGGVSTVERGSVVEAKKRE